MGAWALLHELPTVVVDGGEGAGSGGSRPSASAGGQRLSAATLQAVGCAPLRAAPPLPQTPFHPAPPSVYLSPLPLPAAISRPELSKRVLGSPRALAQLESTVHALVRAQQAAFLAAAAATAAPLAVLDIPLLYETGAEAGCDGVLVMGADPRAQRERALARPGMTPAKLDAIRARQLSDPERRRRADYVIDTSGEGASLEATRRQVAALAAQLLGRRGTAFEQYWQQEQQQPGQQQQQPGQQP